MLCAPNPEGGPDMRFSKQSLVLVGATALLFGAGAAFADDPAIYPVCNKPSNPEDTETAKSLHQIATARFNIQDWDKAIEFWKQAYTIDCNAHGILQNIANAYEKKGDKKSAVVALETYLVRAPNAPDIVKVNERAIELKKSLEPAPTVTATATAAPTITAAPTTTAVVPPPARPYGSIPLVVAGVGGALAIAGAIMIPVGLGPYNEVRDVCNVPAADGALTCPKGTPDLDNFVAKGNAGRATWNAGAALLGIGAVAAAGGLVFHFVWNKPKDTSSAPTSATPAAAPSGGPASAPPPAPKADLHVTPLVGGFSITGKF